MPCAFRRYRGATEAAKRSKQEARRAETALKRQKMREEEQRRKDKVKDRLDLIRQMKGDQRQCKMTRQDGNSRVRSVGHPDRYLVPSTPLFPQLPQSTTRAVPGMITHILSGSF